MVRLSRRGLLAGLATTPFAAMLSCLPERRRPPIEKLPRLDTEGDYYADLDVLVGGRRRDGGYMLLGNQPAQQPELSSPHRPLVIIGTAACRALQEAIPATDDPEWGARDHNYGAVFAMGRAYMERWARCGTDAMVFEATMRQTVSNLVDLIVSEGRVTRFAKLGLVVSGNTRPEDADSLSVVVCERKVSVRVTCIERPFGYHYEIRVAGSA